MGLHIVIDGYNLIRQSRKFNPLDLVDLQMGRAALIDSLAAYKKIKAHSIKIVFDGQSAPTGSPNRERVKGIELIYSRSGESADAVIKRLAQRHGEKLLVVTSDNDIVRYAQSRGAATIDSRAFEDRLMMAGDMDSKGYTEADDREPWRPTTRKKGPARRLPRQQRKMRKKISKL
jgi:predicted RNA-binding protein with PIN domain